jgi:hypothetical protein
MENKTKKNNNINSITKWLIRIILIITSKIIDGIINKLIDYFP